MVISETLTQYIMVRSCTFQSSFHIAVVLAKNSARKEDWIDAKKQIKVFSDKRAG
jgi:hypothetical protein